MRSKFAREASKVEDTHLILSQSSEAWYQVQVSVEFLVPTALATLGSRDSPGLHGFLLGNALPVHESLL